MADLKAAGLLDSSLPPDFSVPSPGDVAALMPDELPLEEEDEDSQGELALDAENDDQERDDEDRDEDRATPDETA